MRMKLALTVAFAVFLGTALTVAQQKTTVFGSPHDILGAGCSGCHAPHAVTDPAGQRGQTLLWVRAFSNQVFGMYTSPTLDSLTAEIGNNTYGDSNPPTGVTQASVLCMSCHDGITTASLIGPSDPDAVGNPTTSFGLTNDHPINMTYDSVADTGLQTSPAAGIVLYGNTVQCGSCHNPHNENGAGNKFLRILNTNDPAGLCGSCHL